VLLDSGSLAVEGVVGRALKALRAAGVETASSGVAESGERRRGARGGAEAEHCVVGIVGCGGSGDVLRGCAGSSLRVSWTFARLTASDSAGVECLRILMTSQRRRAKAAVMEASQGVEMLRLCPQHRTSTTTFTIDIASHISLRCLSERLICTGGTLFHCLLLWWRFKIDIISMHYHKGGV
jgi:hypothetical protein